jgi:hypothetical protein
MPESDVHGAVDDPTRQGTLGALVEGARASCERALTLDDVVDDGFWIRPVRLGGLFREEGSELLRHRGEVGIGPRTRRDQRQRRHPLGMVQGHELGDGPANRGAHQMGTGQAERVEYADSVRKQILARVFRGTGLVVDRPASVAVVIADDESEAGRQPLAEFILPPVHRGRRSADQENRRIAWVAEGLDADIDPVSLDDSLVGPHLSQPARHE